MSELTPRGRKRLLFYPVPVWRFVLMSLFTLGWYELYWFYRCWRYIKEEEESKILPFWRAFFGKFWTYSLFLHVYDGERASLGFVVFTSYWVLGLSAASGYWLLSLFSWLPLLPMVYKVHKLNRAS